MSSVADEIAKLKDLHERGAITYHEFIREKDFILCHGVRPGRDTGAFTWVEPPRHSKGVGVDAILLIMVAVGLPVLLRLMGGDFLNIYLADIPVRFPDPVSALMNAPWESLQSPATVRVMAGAAAVLIIPVLAGIFGSFLARGALALNGFFVAFGYMAAAAFAPELVDKFLAGGAFDLPAGFWVPFLVNALVLGIIFAVVIQVRVWLWMAMVWR